VNERVIVLIGASALLAACKSSDPAPYFPYYPTPSEPTAAPSSQPLSDTAVPEAQQPQDTMFQKTEPAPTATADQPPPEDPNLFSTFVDIIKQTMPTANQGSAVAVRFVNTQTGYRYSSGFVSDDGFVPFQGFPGESISISTSDAGETFTIVMSKMRPGHYECGKDNFALEFATTGVRGTDPAANWSDNPGGACEVDIYDGDNPGDYQGKIAGKLVSNDGNTVFTLESGYFYARRPFLAGQVQGPPARSGPMTRPTIPQGKPKFTH
jgi:hypothetical protein